jgi:hypothetical protein
VASSGFKAFSKDARAKRVFGEAAANSASSGERDFCRVIHPNGVNRLLGPMKEMTK